MNRQKSALEAANVKQVKHKGSIDKPFYVVKVRVELAYLEAFFVHPDNNTYPIFSTKVGQTVVDFRSKCDYDELEFAIDNLQVFDNTNYSD